MFRLRLIYVARGALCARGDGVPRDVPDGVAVLGEGRPLPVFLRYAMPRAGGVQLFAAARPLRLRAGHGTGVEAPLLRGPRVQAGVSRVVARVNQQSILEDWPGDTSGALASGRKTLASCGLLKRVISCHTPTLWRRPQTRSVFHPCQTRFVLCVHEF